MTPRTLRLWAFLHKWASLVCTVFLLMLCLTGLPLLFHHEIDHLLGNEIDAPAMSAATPRADMDEVLFAARAQHPAKVVQLIFREPDDATRWFVRLAPSMTAQTGLKTIVVDARTARVLGESTVQDGFLYIMRKLHIDLFAGLPGTLFLGLMGVLFAVAIGSGIVLYQPFMRKLKFGTVRKDRSPRVKWLDVHNLAGIVTLTWAMVVGLTGVVNTLTLPALNYWQANDLPKFIMQYKGRLAPTQLGSLQNAVGAAELAEPGMLVSFIAFPGSIVSSPYHYATFMRGKSPLTSRLLLPVLVDAQSGEVSASAPLPWYLTSLLISQPLHFGDYGGMPLRILWALLDLLTVVVLASGIYLWVTHRNHAGRGDNKSKCSTEKREG